MRAEAAQSWRAMFARAVEDWHWVIVGGGASRPRSLLGPALVHAGLRAQPARDDSLAALLTNLNSPPEYCSLGVTPVGGDQDPSFLASQIPMAMEMRHWYGVDAIGADDIVRA